MKKANLVTSPSNCSSGSSKEPGHTPFDGQLYRHIVGSLQYLCLIRPDVAFVVNWVSQFMHLLINDHWTMVKRILRYLVDTPTHGLNIWRSHTLNVNIYTDAD